MVSQLYLARMNDIIVIYYQIERTVHTNCYYYRVGVGLHLSVCLRSDTSIDLKHLFATHSFMKQIILEHKQVIPRLKRWQRLCELSVPFKSTISFQSLQYFTPLP